MSTCNSDIMSLSCTPNKDIHFHTNQKFILSDIRVKDFSEPPKIYDLNILKKIISTNNN